MNEDPIKVTIFWGVKELIKDDVGQWDATDMGKVIMDDKFSLSTVAAQNNILKFCDDLQKQAFVLEKGVSCWLRDDFDKWLKSPTK